MDFQLQAKAKKSNNQHEHMKKKKWRASLNKISNLDQF